MAYTTTVTDSTGLGSKIEYTAVEATTLTTSEQFVAVPMGEYDWVRVDVQTVQASSSTDTCTHRLLESSDGTSAKAAAAVAMAVGANQTVQIVTVTTTGSAGTYNNVLSVDYSKNGYKKPKFVLLGSVTSGSNGTKTVSAVITLGKNRA